MRVALSISFLIGSLWGVAQPFIQPLQREYNFNIDRQFNNLDSIHHTSSRPYILSPSEQEILQNEPRKWERKKHDKWFGRKLRNENLIIIDTGLFYMTIDPLFNFELGRDISDTSGGDASTNTRGFLVQGAIGKKFAFYSSFYENQSFFPDYLSQQVNATGVVPGQGRTKPFKTTGFDYAMANGVFAYRPVKFLTIQAGHGKNFFGDGYRSLLLSDNPFNYPYLKLSWSFFNHRLRYETIHASMLELERLPATTSSEAQFIRKAGAFHNLSFSPIPHLEISVFEGTIFENWDSTGTQAVEGTFYSPVIFTNVGVNGLSGQRTNSVLGLNLRLTPLKHLKVYGQLGISESATGSGQMAMQVGTQFQDAFKLENLVLQLEYNQIDESFYDHPNNDLNYVHYNGMVGHPSGNELSEIVAMLNYSFRDFFVNYKFNTIDQSVFKTYTDPGGVVQSIKESEIRAYQDISFGYLINPKTNMQVAFGYRGRSVESSINTTPTDWFYAAFRTNLQNFYYDF